MLGEQAPNGHQVNGNSTLCVRACASLYPVFLCVVCMTEKMKEQKRKQIVFPNLKVVPLNLFR